MKSVRQVPPVFMSGSAVGIYGDRGDEPVTEQTPPGSDFLAEPRCAVGERGVGRVQRPASSWCEAASCSTGMQVPFPGWRCRSVFAGGPLGSGRQYVSWIHRDDWTGIVRWVLANEPTVTGPVNATAPNPVTNLEFAQTLGRVLRVRRLCRRPALRYALRWAKWPTWSLADSACFPPKRSRSVRLQISVTRRGFARSMHPAGP